MSTPEKLATARIDRDRVTIECVVDDLTAVENSTAVDPVAAGLTFRGRGGVRLKFPLQRCPGPSEIKCKQCVWPRRHDVHRIVRNDRGSFLSARHARIERPSYF